MSNLPDFRVNPHFPGHLQPRDRTRAPSQDQITDIATTLSRSALECRPKRPAERRSPGPILLSSPAREGAGDPARLSIGGDQAAAYRAFLQRQGFDVSDMAEPVLIARRVTDLDDAARLDFVTAANRSQTLRMGATETALADARLLDETLISRLVPGDIESRRQSSIRPGFVDKLPSGERGEMMGPAGRSAKKGFAGSVAPCSAEPMAIRGCSTGSLRTPTATFARSATQWPTPPGPGRSCWTPLLEVICLPAWTSPRTCWARFGS